MNQREMFSDAIWLCAGEYHDPYLYREDEGGTPRFPILRAHAVLRGKTIRRATLKAVGLGFFHLWLNGREVTENGFLPLASDYEPRPDHPTGEILTGHRLHVPVFDVTDLLTGGDNTLVMQFGGGWYTYPGGWIGEGEDELLGKSPEAFGDPKAIWYLEAETECGVERFFSSTADKIGESQVRTYHLTNFEAQDLRGFDEAVYTPEFDDGAWKNALPAKPLDTCYDRSPCPTDAVEKSVRPTLLAKLPSGSVYDAGENMSAYPILRIRAKAGETVRVYFGEELNAAGDLDPRFAHRQSFSVISDGREAVVQPLFSWFGFRYMRLEGDGEILSVEKIHSAVRVTSTFDSSSDLLNWIYRTYLNTQLCNMHAGIASDCPHIERRGYTGDGELTAPAVMAMMDAKEFYAKWILDISDCQDIVSGHVQYTAPYTRCGGGPGAWGCAIVEVPYRFWKEYGDFSFAEMLYPQMKKYFEYLEAHSEFGLVTSDKKGQWCLGDWLPPDDVAIPAPFVNNYYYIRSMEQAKKIARKIGGEQSAEDIALFDRRIQERKAAMRAAYFGTWDGNFVGNVQGANAFAADLGLDLEMKDRRTYRYLLDYYRRLGRFDTGICGTEVLTRLLFERGDGELALDLLLSEDPISFAGFRALGFTTLGEYWPHTKKDRSHNHPMFGGCTVNLFSHLLGIRQTEESYGYEDLIIAPTFAERLPRVEGSRRIPQGEVKVGYERDGEVVHAKITLPEGKRAKFLYHGFARDLNGGENRFDVPLS